MKSVAKISFPLFDKRRPVIFTPAIANLRGTRNPRMDEIRLPRLTVATFVVPLWIADTIRHVPADIHQAYRHATHTLIQIYRHCLQVQTTWNNRINRTQRSTIPIKFTVQKKDEMRLARMRILRDGDKQKYADKRNWFVDNERQILSQRFNPALFESDSKETTVTAQRNLTLSERGKRRFPNTVARREREFASVKWQRVMSRCWTKEKRIRYNVTRVIKRQSCWLAREKRCSCALWTGCLPPE